jgi:hypothetical protein
MLSDIVFIQAAAPGLKPDHWLTCEGIGDNHDLVVVKLNNAPVPSGHDRGVIGFRG